jgi:hypothetical protein
VEKLQDGRAAEDPDGDHYGAAQIHDRMPAFLMEAQFDPSQACHLAVCYTDSLCNQPWDALDICGQRGPDTAPRDCNDRTYRAYRCFRNDHICDCCSPKARPVGNFGSSSGAFLASGCDFNRDSLLDV